MRKHIKTLRTQNWQNANHELELTPLTAIIGKNTRGKSAIPAAIRVGLCEYSPAHGKRPSATWGFIGAENGATSGGVELGFSDGVSTNAQKFRMSGGKLERHVNKMDVKVPPVLMDLHEEFFKLSGPKRTDFVFERMDMTKLGFSVEEITARLKKNVKVAEPTELTETKLGDIISDVEELDRLREEAGLSYQDFIARVVTKIKERADTSKATVDQMAGLVQGTTVMQGQAAPPAPFNPDELVNAREHFARLTRQKNNAAQYVSGKAAYEQKRASLKAALDGQKDLTPEITRVEGEIAAKQKAIDGYKSGTNIATTTLDELTTEKLEATSQLNARKSVLADRGDEIKADKKAKCCPKCKAKGAGWAKFIKAEEAELKKEADAIAKEGERIAALQPGIDAATKRLETAKKADEAQNTRRGELNALNRSLNELRSANITCKVAMKNGDAITHETLTIDAAKERIKSIDENVGLLMQATPPNEEELAKAKAEVERLEGVEREHNAAEGVKLQQEEARAKHADAVAEKEVADLAGKELAKIKTEMMEKAFNGFMQKVNRFTDGLLPNCKKGLAFRDGEIGYFRGATWVSLDHFSGTEELLTYVGLAVALAEESPVRIVFVDEWLRDEDLQDAVPKRLAELVAADVIDQAIIIDTRNATYKKNGFSIVEL